MIGEDIFIVKSGSGYFLEFTSDTPKMTTDPVEARRLKLNGAKLMIEYLDIMGFDAELVCVRIGRISEGK